MTNSGMTNVGARRTQSSFGHSSFIRISGFVIRHSPRAASRLHHPVNRVLEHVKADGLGQVFVEAGVAGAADVLVHAEAAERDAADGLAEAELAHEVQPGAVGEADVAD